MVFPPRNPTHRSIVLALTAGIGFFLLGYGGIMASGGNAEHASPVWPATAFGMCIILRLSRSERDDALMFAAILTGSILANLMGGAPGPLSIGYSLVNLLDAMSGLFAIRYFAPPRFTSFKAVARFSAAALISPSLLGGILAALLVWGMGQPQWLTTGVQWFWANVLGVCILFPFGMTVSLRQFAKLKLKARFPEAALVFTTVAAIAALSFRFDAYPLKLLILPAALVAAARFRLLGAGAGLIIVGALALAIPTAFAGTTVLPRIELLQGFLAITSLICVRTALVLNERDLHVALIERRRRRALRASRFKTQLLSHVSHEVRSPLSAIIGFSAMLESGTLAADRAPEFARIIAHNGELLRRLHDDLLDLSRAEVGALSIIAERVPVRKTLDDCVNALRLDAALGGKDVVVDGIEDSLAVSADPFRLAQILNNLIANAYKYGDNFSPIRVRAERRADGYGRIEIVNAGPGIAESERDTVFRPFGRGRGVGRNVPGAGLGLSIAKILVEAQGGRIDFESVPGRQTRFWIDLPLAA